MNGLEAPKFEESPEKPESISDSLGLRELSDMLAEMGTDDETVLQIIEDTAGMEPIPDPNDVEACLEFDRKMAILNDLAQTYLGRSERLLEARKKIEDKVRQKNQASN